MFCFFEAKEENLTDDISKTEVKIIMVLALIAIEARNFNLNKLKIYN
jgi:hypothetical protein